MQNEYGSEFHIEETAEARAERVKCSKGTQKEGSAGICAGKDLLSAFAVFPEIRFLRCGRDALGLIAADIAADCGTDAQPEAYAADAAETGAVPGETAAADSCRREKNCLTVYIPALSCDSMVAPFAVRGFTVRFYPVRADLAPETETLLQMMAEDSRQVTDTAAAGDSGRVTLPPVVLLMNFYGCTDIAETARILRAAEPSVILIEDVTHLLPHPEAYLFAGGSVRTRPDVQPGASAADTACCYTIGSIRKWLGVPDGAFAAKHGGAFGKETALLIRSGDETPFVQKRLEAGRLKREYLRICAAPEDRQDTREGHAQRADEELPQSPAPALKARFRALFAAAEASLDDGKTVCAMSGYAERVVQTADWSAIRRQRDANYRHLYRLLSAMREAFAGNGKGEPPFRLLPETARHLTPFMLPVVLSGPFTAVCPRDELQARLAKQGVYAPVLWPIAKEAEEISPVAGEIADRMLCFWIDQRYGTADMDVIAGVFRREVEGVLLPGGE